MTINLLFSNFISLYSGSFTHSSTTCIILWLPTKLLIVNFAFCPKNIFSIDALTYIIIGTHNIGPKVILGQWNCNVLLGHIHASDTCKW